MRGFNKYVSCISFRLCGTWKHLSSLSALQLFDEIPLRNNFQFEKRLKLTTKQNNIHEILDSFRTKAQIGISLTKYDLCAALSSCTKTRSCHLGLQIHAKIIQSGHEDNLVLNSSLVDFYAKCSRIEDARRVFDGMKRHDQVSWTSIISGYAQCGFGVEAILLFKKMIGCEIKPNCFTYVSVIGACVGLEEPLLLGLIHANVIRLGYMTNSFVVSCLIDCYSKCGSVDGAVLVFNGASTKDNIIYNSMISGYCQNRYYEDALELFVQMRKEGVSSTHFTMSSILNACGRLSVLQLGRQLHCAAIKLGSVTNMFVLSSLVDMYSKSGSLDEARMVFDSIIEKNSVIWTNMVSGYAQSGRAAEALEMIDQMVEEGLRPDHVCFTAVLTACNHSGFLDRAVNYFYKMRKDYGLVPTLDQYACLIDMHARKGHLQKAMQLMGEMPFDPNCVILSSLLSCCKTYGAVELGTQVANQLFDMQPDNAAAYLTMSHIYSEAGLQDEVTNMRKLMKQRVTKKIAAWSWIEVDGKTEVFLVGDVSHPMSDHIFVLLEHLNLDIKDTRSIRKECEHGDVVSYSCC